MKIENTTIFKLKKVEKFVSDKIYVETFSKKNLIELSLESKEIEQAYLKLIQNNYIHYMHANGKSYFIKRSKVYTIWQRTDLLKEGDTFYTIDFPKEKKINELTNMSMCVVFSNNPLDNKLYSSNIAERHFVKNFPTIDNHLIKNTIILRIMDLNMTYGSQYLNTPNFEGLEMEVQKIINKVSKDNNISKDSIVLYGSGKGGIGALYHSYLGGVNSVSVGPSFTYDQVENEFIPSGMCPEKVKMMRQKSEKDGMKHYVISSPQIISNYEAIQENLDQTNVKIIDICDNSILTTNDISLNTSVESVQLINQILMSSLAKEKMVSDIKSII